METMGKLIKMKVVIVGMRGLGVEIAKNLILAGPNSVSLYDPDITRINDLGANFYLEEKHVGKVSRAEAVREKLNELNPYVKVQVITDIEAAIKSGDVHVVCQTEMLLNGKHVGHSDLNKLCRENNCGYLGSQTFGPWGFAFVDYGDKHIVTDHNGEQTKNFVVSMIDKGATTFVTVHEDKRHIYEEGDFVTFREVEGMTEINDSGPYKIIKTTPFTFVIDCDSTGFGDYARQGTVENVKVPKPFPMHSWEQSFANPAASTAYGFMEPPDLSKFGRSEQLHAALFGIE
tara:strand:- start:1104 stop:1967 length:864 start_codon:yes stop_codon:yes gene_type:complete